MIITHKHKNLKKYLISEDFQVSPIGTHPAYVTLPLNSIQVKTYLLLEFIKL